MYMMESSLKAERVGTMAKALFFQRSQGLQETMALL
jgi:hypothetical protein